MANADYVPNRVGMREMLGSPEVLDSLLEAAGEIRDRAVAMVSEDEMDNDAFYASGRIDSKGMARASVYAGNPHGENACLSSNVLLKAMG